MMIDKNSPVPLYYQIAEHLKGQILAGDLVSGARLTSERDLSEIYGVSRMTVRQAINYLLTTGLVEVRQGVGTFVAQPKHTYDAIRLLGFSDEVSRHGGRAESVVLEQALVQPPSRLAGQLHLPAHALALKITRLRNINGEPVLLETSFLPAHLCPGLESADLSTHSLYALLETNYNLRLLYTRQTMECVLANEYEQRIFGLGANAAMFLVEGVAYGDEDAPIEFFKAVYRGDRCKFRLESQRTGLNVHASDDQRVSVVVG